MTVQELIAVLGNLSADMEVRIGDQLDLGPYSHDRVGGVWTSRPNHAGDIQYVILCAEDTNWQDEFEGDIKSDDELPLVWMPPAPILGEMQGDSDVETSKQ